MKAQALLLSACGLTALAAPTTVTGPAATVSVQATSTVFETVIKAITHYSPQPSDNASVLLAKRPNLEKRCAYDDYCPSIGFIEPRDVSCGDFKKDVKCGRSSWLEKIEDPLNSDRMDAYVACVQSCRKDNGLNRLIFYKGKYLDMSLEEYDEWIRNGAESKSAASTAATSTTSEAGAKTVTKADNVTTSWDGHIKSTGFKTSFRTISSSAPSASSSVLLGERSATEQDSAMHPCRRSHGEQKCRTKCGWGGAVFPKCYKKCWKKWAKKHCRNNEGLMERAEDTNSTKVNDSTIVERDVQGNNHDNHHCNNWSVRTRCHYKASWHLFDRQKHYKRCIKKCIRKHHGDNYGQPEEEIPEEEIPEEGIPDEEIPDEESPDEAGPDEEGPDEESEGGFLSKRSESEGGPCDVGTWANAWCGVKSNWHWHREKAFNKCIDQCLREHSLDAMVTKRSDNGTAGNDTALLTSKLASTTVSLGHDHRDDWPYNGKIGPQNNHDNHHCNNASVYWKCGFKGALAFWNPYKHFYRCVGKCVIKHNGDNWTEEDAEGEGGEQ